MDLDASGPTTPTPTDTDDSTADAVVRATFDTAPDGVVVLGRDDRILVWNQRFVALWSFPPEMLARRDSGEMRLHTASLLIDPESYFGTINAVRGISHAQFFSPIELKDGRYFERHASPLQAVPGVPQSAGGIIVRWRDVTLRHQAEQRQRELSTLLDLALMGADLAYWDVNVETGEVHSANERWFSILGYRPEDLHDNFDAWDDLVHPDDATRRMLAWEAHISGAVPRYEAEFRMRHKQGHWIWLQARGQAVARGPDGRATRLVGTRQDITEHKLAEQGLLVLAHTDELTGVHNRRRFIELATEELARARRYGHPVTLLMIDLDHFKAVNDRHGHAGGDEVLRSFVQTARTVMRQSDVFGRIGGEEFAALLPHTALQSAQIIAERLLDQINGHAVELPHGQSVRYTVSLGVAEAQGHTTVPELMAAADKALYAAKAQGRNRSMVAGQAPHNLMDEPHRPKR
jgi:diguanylate cyclase (GGDEF)-like protein/PAS domain S-box-containing protein